MPFLQKDLKDSCLLRVFVGGAGCLLCRHRSLSTASSVICGVGRCNNRHHVYLQLVDSCRSAKMYKLLHPLAMKWVRSMSSDGTKSNLDGRGHR